MWGMFVLIYTVADPLMGWCEGALNGPGAWVAGLIGPGPLHDLWLDGIVAGVGGVLVFVPQIALLILVLSCLEQCGYLARATVLLDRPLTAVGLHGRSFVALLTSHACAIPGIMAARSIDNHRDRLATMLVAPFMACGARLPVYFLLIALLFSGQSSLVQGTILAGLYVLGIVAAVVVALILRLGPLPANSAAFSIDLGPYRWPNPRQVLREVATQSWMFVKKAGTVILAFSVLLWAGLTYPGLDETKTPK